MTSMKSLNRNRLGQKINQIVFFVKLLGIKLAEFVLIWTPKCPNSH